MHTRCVPELPEVHALAADLDGRLRGRVLDRFDVTSFAALKTFDPPVSALHGMLVAGVARHGKFLDITAVPREGEAGEPLHLIIHLARAGWIRWRDAAPIAAAPRAAAPTPAATPHPGPQPRRAYAPCQPGPPRQPAPPR